jgi:ankyrin repeat protein
MEMVKLLLSRGAEINSRDGEGRTALMWAAQNGRREIVAFLLAQGADVNAEDREGKKALDLAKADGKLMEILFLAEGRVPGSPKK